MKIIKISICGHCPWVERACNGLKPVCKETSIIVKYPYSEKRRVELDKAPPKFCPLEEVRFGPTQTS